ncbi:MAG: nicotinamide riboside transporter PnuC, partial [bacterium]
MVTDWIADNIIEIFGAVTGIAYVILEIKRNILLWPLGIVTSAVYIYVFGRNGIYANMGLQWYYLLISIYGWYKWHRTNSMERGAWRDEPQVARRASGILEEGATHPSFPSDNTGNNVEASRKEAETDIRRINLTTAIGSAVTALLIWALLWYVLDRWTDSPVPLWDGLIASLSVVATW